MAAETGIWVNGVKGAGIPGDDPGLLLGLTAFETLRTYGDRPFRLEAHVDRLEASAAVMEIEIPSREDIVAEIHTLCVPDAFLRYTVTAGGNRIVQTEKIEEARVGGPVRVARMNWVNPASLPGGVKHGARASWVLAARRKSVDEVLLVDPDGHILEANRSNVFAVVRGELRTPPLDGRQLAGVTRSALLEAAAEVGILCREIPLHVDDDFEEFYLASTLKELAPVVSIDSRGLPGFGPIGERLYQAFRQLVARETVSL